MRAIKKGTIAVVLTDGRIIDVRDFDHSANDHVVDAMLSDNPIPPVMGFVREIGEHDTTIAVRDRVRVEASDITSDIYKLGEQADGPNIESMEIEIGDSVMRKMHNSFALKKKLTDIDLLQARRQCRSRDEIDEHSETVEARNMDNITWVDDDQE